MKATKSKMSKQFTEHRERGLRCMADGGLVGNRMQRMEAMAGAAAPVTLSANPGMASMTPQPVQPVAAPQPVQPMTPEEAEWQRIKAEKLAPKPTIMSKVKKTFGFADGGAADIKRNGLRGAMRAAEVHEGPGKVKGPGTKTSDSIPARLSKDEYVLPGDTVEAVGVENLDQLVMDTHEFVNKPTLRNGVVHAADGDPGLRYRRFTPNAGPQPSAATSTITGVQPPVQRGIVPSLSPEARAYEAARGAVQPGGGTAAPAATVVSNKPTTPSFRGNPFAGGAAIAAIPAAVQAYNTPTSEYARRLGVDEPSSFMGDLAVRGAGTLQDFGNMLTGGIADRVGNAAITADDPGGMSFGHSPAYNAPVQPAATAQPASPAAATVAAPVRPPSQAAAPAPQAGTSLRSSSVGNNVTITGDGGPEPVMMQTRAGREAQLRAAYAPTQYEGRPGQSTNSLVAEANPIGTPQLPAGSIGEQFDRDVAAKRGLRTQRLQMELDQRERDSMRQYGAAAERNAVTLRGQDMTAKTASEAGARDQANKDRQYELDVAKYGNDRANVLQQRRESAEKATATRIAGILPPVRDQKGNLVPDTQSAARYMSAVQAEHARRVEFLRKKAASDPRAAKDLAQFEERGLDAFGADDLQDIIASDYVKGVSAEDAGGLRGGTHVVSQEPITSLRRERNIFSPNMFVDPKTGLRVRESEVLRPGNTLGFGGTRNTTAERLIKEN